MKYHTMLLFTALFMFSCALIESRGVQGPEARADWLQTQNLRSGIISAVLASRGSSANEIEDIIAASNGDVETAVSGINAALNENLLRVEEGAVRVNPDAIRSIVRNALQSSIRQRLPQNSGLVSALENGVNEQINAENAQFDAAVERSAVPLDVAKRSLTVRQKRSLEPRLDLVEILGDTVRAIIEGHVATLLSGVLDSVKSVLEGILIVTAPGDPLLDFLAGLVNFAVKGLIQVVTVLQQTLTGGTQSAASLALDVQIREKRALTDIISGDDTNETVGGLLDGIVGPVLSLIANLTTPVNQLLKSVITSLSNLLQPVLGRIIISKVGNLVVAIIDLIIPANPI